MRNVAQSQATAPNKIAVIIQWIILSIFLLSEVSSFFAVSFFWFFAMVSPCFLCLPITKNGQDFIKSWFFHLLLATHPGVRIRWVCCNRVSVAIHDVTVFLDVCILVDFLLPRGLCVCTAPTVRSCVLVFGVPPAISVSYFAYLSHRRDWVVAALAAVATPRMSAILHISVAIVLFIFFMPNPFSRS